MMNLSRIRKSCLTIIVTLVVGVGASQSAWGGYEEGLDAYKRKDYATAFKEWMPLAKEGNKFAQFKLGWLYRVGSGVRLDVKEAVRWWRKAAEQGHASAQSNLAFMYLSGRGVLQDKKVAAKWYRKAAELGDAPGQYKLGEMYDDLKKNLPTVVRGRAPGYFLSKRKTCIPEEYRKLTGRKCDLR